MKKELAITPDGVYASLFPGTYLAQVPVLNHMDIEETIGIGPVIVRGFFHEPRICYFDGLDGDAQGKDVALVYLGDPVILLERAGYLVPPGAVNAVNTDILVRRHQELEQRLASAHIDTEPDEPVPWETHLDLWELRYVDSVLAERMMVARFDQGGPRRSVFISHSKTDAQLARWLAVDLRAAGHGVWLDEWELVAGQAIPTEIAKGVENCDIVVVLLSQASTASGWVEAEWQAKYWTEVTERRMSVIPARVEECTIPTLLRPKKYADFSRHYQDGLNDIIQALARG